MDEKEKDKPGFGEIEKPSGGLSRHIFSTQAQELFSRSRPQKRSAKVDIFESRILPEHWKPQPIQTASILAPVLQAYKIEAVRQKKTLKALVSEALFEYGMSSGIITKDDLKK